ncbi:MAG: DUF2254 family protein [Pseudomonadota bacterium]
MNLDMTDALIAVQDMLNGFIERLPYIVMALLVFALFYLAGRTVRYGIRRFSARRHRHRNLGLVLGRLAQALIIFIGTLVAPVIVLPSFRPGQLVQLLGIGSVAIGFDFRHILQNFMAGILLLLHEPFRIGDQIRVAAFEGVVEDIPTRATMNRTYDGRRIAIPNARLFADAVIVNTAHAQRRLEYELGIGYGDDIEDVKALMLQAVREVPGVLAEPAPDVLMVGLAGSAIKLRVRWWIEPPRQADALDAQDQVLAAIRRALGEHGIDLPFETRVLLFHDQTESSDGDRRRQREGWPAGPGEAPRTRTIAASMITVAGVTFSITVVTLTLASNQFGPRLLRNFMRDTGNQIVLGTFIATFINCLLVRLTVRVPYLSVTVGMLLAIVSLGVLIYFIHHVSESIQAENLIAVVVAAEPQAGIDRLFPNKLGQAPQTPAPRPRVNRFHHGRHGPLHDPEPAQRLRAGRGERNAARHRQQPRAQRSGRRSGPGPARNDPESSAVLGVLRPCGRGPERVPGVPEGQA